MTQPVITIHGNVSVLDAPGLMRQEQLRGFHVVDEKVALTGDVSECNSNPASPTSARCLSGWEPNDLITRIEVGSGTRFNVISVTENRMVTLEVARLHRACL